MLRRNLIAGALAGLAGGLLFATAHAFIIVPIWSRLASGLLSGVAAGVVAGWAYTELRFDASITSGAQFGALLWFAVTPVTLVDAVLRALGFANRYEIVEVVVAVALALAGGAFLGQWRARRRRAIISGAAAALVLTMAMAGPVPIARNARALGIFLAVLPAALISGAVLGGLSRAFRPVAP